jgi:hypothetical protein
VGVRRVWFQSGQTRRCEVKWDVRAAWVADICTTSKLSTPQRGATTIQLDLRTAPRSLTILAASWAGRGKRHHRPADRSAASGGGAPASEARGRGQVAPCLHRAAAMHLNLLLTGFSNEWASLGCWFRHFRLWCGWRGRVVCSLCCFLQAG